MDYERTVTITLEDGSSCECLVVCMFDGYVALQPVEDLASEEGRLYFFAFEEDEEGQPTLLDIASDQEYEEVVQRFDAILEEVE